MASGARVDAAVWSDAAVSWRDYDLVLVRSCWDYHLRLDEFLRWLASLEAQRVAIRNPLALIRWNANKRYLRDLGESGVPVVPTAWIRAGGLAQALGERGWSDAVVKPAIGASAFGTFRTSPATAADDERRLAGLLASRAICDELLLQPFVAEVVSNGEWSLVFLSDGLRPRFSHAVLKRPARGDFRVQRELGGSAQPGRPAEARLAEAAALLEHGCALASVPSRDVLYARVDAIVRDGHLELMELECIEPELFFAQDPEAAPRLAGGIAAALSGRPAPRPSRPGA